MQRVVVFGHSGSGKTTLARWLGERYGLPFIDLDDVFWRPGWVEPPENEFRAAVQRIADTMRWAVAGNYGIARQALWPRADTLIWLDLPLAQVLSRCAARALQQWWTAESICNGNRQSLTAIFCGRDSLLGYTLRTHRQHRHEWPQYLLAHSQAAHVHLRSATAVAAWKQRIGVERQAGNTPVLR